MQIELIGCTSAGKSTLARHMVQAYREQGHDAFLADEFVLKQCGLSWIRNVPLRKILINLAGLFASAVTWRKNRQLNFFAAKLLLQLPASRLEKLALLRNVLKKVGIGEIVRARSRAHEIVVVDEGVLQVAHNLFVHLATKPAMDAIAPFVRLAPQPDVVVYVRPDVSTLIERTMQRGHRRIAELTRENVACFVERAVATFDRMAKEPTVQRKLLVVDSAQQVATVSQVENSMLALTTGLTGTVKPHHVA